MATTKIWPAKHRIVGIAIVILSLLFLAWSLWPLPFQQIIPDFEEETLSAIQVHLRSGTVRLPDGQGVVTIDLDPASSDGQELLALLGSTRYHRVLDFRGYSDVTLDYGVYITFGMGEGETACWDGTLFFTGDPTMTVSGSFANTSSYAAYGGVEWQQQVLDFLLTQMDTPLATTGDTVQ